MSLATMLLQVLIQYGPDAYAKWVEIMHKTDPTKDDFLAVLDAISKETYEGFIDAARVAHGLPVPPLPAGV